MTEAMELHDGHWRPSVPLPLYSVLHVRCHCGARFWGWRIQIRCNARERYEHHFRSEHIYHTSRGLCVADPGLS